MDNWFTSAILFMCPSTTYFAFWGQGIFLHDLGQVQCSDKSIAIMSSRTLVDEQQEGSLSVVNKAHSDKPGLPGAQFNVIITTSYLLLIFWCIVSTRLPREPQGTAVELGEGRRETQEAHTNTHTHTHTHTISNGFKCILKSTYW